MQEPYRKGSSESILTSSLAGDIARCFLKRRQRHRWAGPLSCEKPVDQDADQRLFRKWLARCLSRNDPPTTRDTHHRGIRVLQNRFADPKFCGETSSICETSLTPVFERRLGIWRATVSKQCPGWRILVINRRTADGTMPTEVTSRRSRSTSDWSCKSWSTWLR